MSWLDKLGENIQYAHAVNYSGPAYYQAERAAKALESEGKTEEAKEIRATMLDRTVDAAMMAGLGKGVWSAGKALLRKLLIPTIRLIGGMAGGIGGMYAGDKLVHTLSDGKYDTWGDMVQDKTNGAFGSTLAHLSNPLAILGGFAGGWGANKAYTGTKRGKADVLSGILDGVTDNTKVGGRDVIIGDRYLSNIKHSRVKVGDVEINDPNLAYRQIGESVAREFPVTGRQVPTLAESEYGMDRVLKPTGIILGKAPFPNPMYAQGHLWYGLPQEGSTMTGLLTTNQPLLYANKSARLVLRKPIITFEDGLVTTVYDPRKGSIVGTRRVPLQGQLNSSNTNAYIYDPKYGYKIINTLQPKTSLAFFEGQPANISEAERLGIPKGERNAYLIGANADPSYYAAIGLNNPRYTQALRDFHFTLKFGLNGVNENGLVTFYHGSPNPNKTYLRRPGIKYGGRATKGLGWFATTNKKYAQRYTVPHLLRNTTPTGKVYELYINSQKPYIFGTHQPIGRLALTDVTAPTLQTMQKYWRNGFQDLYYPFKMGNKGSEYVIFNPTQFKFRDPITYDNHGRIIPLSKRDNPTLNDMRYKSGGSIHIKKKNKGKFTDYCGGKVTLECIRKGKKSSNPTTRKRANFAANARKWKHEDGGTINYLNYFN